MAVASSIEIIPERATNIPRSGRCCSSSPRLRLSTVRQRSRCIHRSRIAGSASTASVIVAVIFSPSLFASASVGGNCETAMGTSGSCQAPVTDVQALVEVAANIALVTVNHTYVSDIHPINDAELLLALPVGAMLLDFEVHVGGRSSFWSGKVRALEQNVKPAACTSHYTSYDSTPSTRKLPLGRIERSEKVVARLKYTQELLAQSRPALGSVLRFTLPVATGPRRKPAGAAGPSGARANTPLAATVRVSSTGCSKDSSEAPKVVGQGSICVAGASEACVAASFAGSTDAALHESFVISSPTSGVQLDVSDPHHAGVCDGDWAVTGTLRSKTLQDMIIEIGGGGSVAPVTADATAMEMSAPAIANATTFAPSVVLEEHPATGRLAALVALPTTLPPVEAAAYDWVLILDNSPSMRGSRARNMQRVARIFLRSLPTEGRFNFVGFDASGTNLLLFPDGSRVLDKASFAAAGEHIAASEGGSAASIANRQSRSTALPPSTTPMQASTGAARYVEAAFAQTREAATQLRVLVITDRHAPDADAAIELVKARCNADCKLSVVGMGWGASPPFVDGLAKAGGGTSRFVAERGGAAAIERAVVALMSDGLQPVVRDVVVDWEGSSDVAKTPKAATSSAELGRLLSKDGISDVLAVPGLGAPDVLGGGRTLALAFLGGGRLGEKPAAAVLAGKVRVRATVGGRPVDVLAPVGKARRGRAVHTLCARRLADHLGLGDTAGTRTSNVAASADMGGGSVAEASQQAEDLGLAYGLETAQTQWVAVSATPSAVSSSTASRPVTERGATAADATSVTFGTPGLAADGKDAIVGENVDMATEANSAVVALQAGRCSTLSSQQQQRSVASPAKELPGRSASSQADTSSTTGGFEVLTSTAKSDSEGAGSLLSTRHQPGTAFGRVSDVDSDEMFLPRFGAHLAVLDFESLASSISLKHTPIQRQDATGVRRRQQPLREGGAFGSSAFDSAFSSAGENQPLKQHHQHDASTTLKGRGLSVRSLHRIASRPAVMGVARVGASLSVGGSAASASPPAWPVVSDDRSDIDEFSSSSRWNDFGAPIGTDFHDVLGTVDPSQPRRDERPMLATRNKAGLGGSLGFVGGSGGTASKKVSETTMAAATVRVSTAIPAETSSSPLATVTASRGGDGERNLGEANVVPATAAASSDSSGQVEASGSSSLAAGVAALDFGNLGSALSVRKPSRRNDYEHDRAFGFGRPTSSLSMMDFLFMGSSLALSAHGFAKKSMSVFGAHRLSGAHLGSDADFWDDPTNARGMRATSGVKAGKDLSLRSFARMSSSLSVVSTKDRDEGSFAFADRLSVIDFTELGASLALRGIHRTTDRRTSDFASSYLGTKGVPGDTHGRKGSKGSGDFFDIGGFGGAHGTGGDTYGWPGLSEGGRTGGGVLSDMMLPGIGAGPSSWVAVGVVGGAPGSGARLAAPVAALWRIGTTCQGVRETVSVTFQAPGVDVSSTILLYSAHGAVIDNSTAGGATIGLPAAINLDAAASGDFDAFGTLDAFDALGGSAAGAGGGVDHAAAHLIASIPVGRSTPGAVSVSSGASSLTSTGNWELRLSVSISSDCQISVRSLPVDGGEGSPLLEPTTLPRAHQLEDLFGGEDGFFNDDGEGFRGSGGVQGTPEQLREALDARRAAFASGGAPLRGGLPIEARAESTASAASSSSGRGGSFDDVDQQSALLFQSLLGAQRFDGAFDFDDATNAGFSVRGDKEVTRSGISTAHLLALVDAWRQRGDEDADTFADIRRLTAHTAAAVATLASEYPSLRDNWVLVEAKALRWLEQSGGAAAARCGSAKECVDAADLAVARWSPGIGAAASTSPYDRTFGAGGGGW
eukprot:TRINITY_DN40766_c0_g1_i1.p1 TRINITY_DN40766_c0_g1~~TRINITY_DN40766_c0_g1_i1.p1  ORF type:complete len:1849 (-),score=317.76 TRINITY_DN40766_c0_g1_i1:29-5575(-)